MMINLMDRCLRVDADMVTAELTLAVDWVAVAVDWVAINSVAQSKQINADFWGERYPGMQILRM